MHVARGIQPMPLRCAQPEADHVDLTVDDSDVTDDSE